MVPFRSWLLLIVLSSGCGLGVEPAQAHGPSADHEVDALRSRAMARYHVGDFAGMVELMQVVTERSDDDTDDYNLACGLALTGRLDDAIVKLEYLVDRGSIDDLLDDSDFTALLVKPAFHRLVARVAFHAEADRQLEPVREMAAAHYEAGQYGAYVQIMERVAKYSNSSVDLYNLACGYALNGQREEALTTLERLADRDADHGVAHDSDFASLRAEPRFHAVLGRLSG